MNKITFMTTSLTLAMLSGCANDQHVYYQDKCITCMNNPLTGKPVNYDPDGLSEGALVSREPQADQRTADGYPPVLSLPGMVTREQLRMTYSGDVDTAAARLKNAFGYMTKEEAVAESGMGGKMMFAAGDYAFSAVPGSHYVMVRLYSGGKLTTRVSKSPSGADVEFAFGDRGKREGPPADVVMEKVKTVAEAALQGFIMRRWP